MKRLILMILVVGPLGAHAQWRDIGLGKPDATGASGIFPAIGVHNHQVFLSSKYFGVIKYTSMGWVHADSGIDFSQGDVNSFSSLGAILIAGIIHPDNRPGPSYYTSDSGRHWIQTGIASPVNAGDGYLLARGGTGIYRSLDTSASWQRVADIPVADFGIIGSCALAWTGSKLWRSIDSGTSWREMDPTPNGLSFKAFTSIASELFAGQAGVYRSTDSGSSWTQIGLTDKIVYSLASSDGYLFAGTDSGVYVSLDTGATWRNVSDGMKGWKGYIPHVLLLAVSDSMLYATVQASTLISATDYNGYATARPIREMVDTTESKVVTSPPQVADDIWIYPNPAQKLITVGSSKSPILRVDVVNVLGAVVGSQSAHSSSTSIDLSQFASGTYYLRIETDKRTAMKKIVRE